MANKKITIESLAIMIANGFEGAATKDQVENLEKWTKGRFDNIDSEIRKINKQLTGVVYRHEFEELEIRVKKLESLITFSKGK